MKIKIGRNIIACVVILMIMIPGVSALIPADYPQPSYITVRPGEVIEVDGYFSDWDLDKDFFAYMYNQGNSNPEFSGYVKLSKLYLRYDCGTETLYALVLCETGYKLKNTPSNMWIKEYDLFYPNSKKIIGMDDGDPGTYHYIYSGSDTDKIIGWEASGILAPGDYEELEAHAQIFDEQIPSGKGKTSSTGTISLIINCNNNEIPEYPHIALPIMMILGIMFILQSRKRKED